MDLFTPVVPQERQHPNFRTLVTRCTEGDLGVLREWASGLPDRDGKFVTEFQTTFNSCFWELYLNAAFNALGFVQDFQHAAPDFSCAHEAGAFTAEAVIASNAEGYAAEWEARPAEPISPERKRAMLEYASVRLANAFDAKLKKYRSSYTFMPHVAERPFVVCIAPFEQPFFFTLADRPLRRVLYAYDMPVYMDDEERGVRVVLGEAAAEQVWKPSGAEVTFGLFRDERANEVSAVIFSSVATLSKVTALAPPSRRTMFSALRYDEAATEPRLVEAWWSDYRESLLDGLHLFLNPYATHPLNPALFAGREVAIHHGLHPELGVLLSHVPNGFLIARSSTALSSEKNGKATQPAPPARGRLPALVAWPEGELRHVGGHFTTFEDIHLAHYRGWTILLARDQVDNDWGAQACFGIYKDLMSWFEGARSQGGPLMGPGFFPCRDQAFDAIRAEVNAAPTPSR